MIKAFHGPALTGPSLAVHPLASARTQHRDHRYRTGDGTIFHGLGEGPGSVLWQSDVMPSQFWHDPHWSNEQRLCASVLQNAIDCLYTKPGLTHYSLERARDEAEAWLLSDDPGAWVLSFVGVCEVLGLDPRWMRAGILAGKEAA